MFKATKAALMAAVVATGFALPAAGPANAQMVLEFGKDGPQIRDAGRDERRAEHRADRIERRGEHRAAAAARNGDYQRAANIQRRSERRADAERRDARRSDNDGSILQFRLQ